MPAELESATAAGFATASGLDHFTATSWFDAASVVATATTFAEQLAEQAFDFVSATRCVTTRVDHLATTSRSCYFASASRCSDFATASWLDDLASAVTATVFLGEQLLQQAKLWLATRAVTTRVHSFTATSRHGDFAATCRFDVATAITVVATKFAEQSSAGAGGACDYESESQQSRNQYTTHRISP